MEADLDTLKRLGMDDLYERLNNEPEKEPGIYSDLLGYDGFYLLAANLRTASGLSYMAAIEQARTLEYAWPRLKEVASIFFQISALAVHQLDEIAAQESD